MLIRSLSFLIIILISVDSFSQQLNYEQFSLKEGLPHNEVYDIDQSPDQLIWIATEGGIASFDGKSFSSYTTEEGMPDNNIGAIFCDSNYRVWFSTSKGVGYIYKEKIEHFQALNTLTGDMSYINIDESPEGILYFFFHDKIIQYKSKSKDSISVVLRYQDYENIKGNYGIVLDENTLFFAYYGNDKFHLAKLHLDCKEIEIIPCELRSCGMFPKKLARDSIGGVWIASSIIMHYDNKSIKAISETRRTFGLHVVDESILWWSSEGSGFGSIEIKSKQTSSYSTETGLPSPYIYDVFLDRENNIWLATYGQGLIKYGDPSLRYYNDKNGLPSKTIYNTIEYDDQIAIATDNGLVLLTNGKIVDTLIREKTKSIAISDNDELIIAKEGEIISIDRSLKQKSLLNENLLNIYVLDKYIITTDGSYIYDHSGGGENQLMSGNIREALPFGKGYIFRDLFNIKYVYVQNDEFIVKELLDKSSYNNFRTMDSISSMELIIKSNKHLHILTYQDDSILIDSKEINFNASKINSVAIQDSLLWMGGSNQLIAQKIDDIKNNKDNYIEQIKLSTNSFDALLLDDGLLIAEDGLFYLSSLNGLWIFDKTLYRESSVPAKTAFKTISVNGMELKNKDEIGNFKYNENQVSIEMQAVSFANPAEIKYKYRLTLDDLTSPWSAPTDQSQVELSYLSPGKYVFEFIASNGYNTWTELPQRYYFSINLPIWKSLRFWSFLLLILSSILFFLYSRNQKTKILQQRKMTEAVIDVTEDSKREVAREIHDSLGQKLILLVRKSRLTNEKSLEQLAESSLVELRNISKGLYPVSLSKLGLKFALIDLIEEVDDNSEIFFDHDIESVADILPENKHLHIFRIVQELLNNILKHSKATEASITVKALRNEVKISVEDNGIGYDKNLTANSEKLSLGLLTIKERLGYIEGQILVETFPSGGTKVEILIPI